MEGSNVNVYGRCYKSGVPLSDDYRSLIISHIISIGGDRVTGFFPSNYSRIAQDIKVSPNTVKKIWTQFCESYNIESKKRGGDYSSKLSGNDLELIETLKAEKGSISLKEIYQILEQVGDVGGDISISSISRAIKSRLLSGKTYTRKKITQIARERFTYENMLYTQLFIDYLSSTDIEKIRFFDEAGVKVPDVGTRLYGHSPIGERCVEVVRKKENPNTTLNLLVSLNGVEYYNLIDGASNTAQFLNFFEEAAGNANMITLRPALEVGNIVVMDNLSVHHFDGGEFLEDFLANMGIELLYTPVYSPDLNPVEMCFNKVKTSLNQDYNDLVHFNVKLATSYAVQTITGNDMRGFYNHTSYLF